MSWLGIGNYHFNNKFKNEMKKKNMELKVLKLRVFNVHPSWIEIEY